MMIKLKKKKVTDFEMIADDFNRILEKLIALFNINPDYSIIELH